MIKLYRFALIYRNSVIETFALPASDKPHAIDKIFRYIDLTYGSRLDENEVEIFMLNCPASWAVFMDTNNAPLDFNGHVLFNPFNGKSYGQDWTVVAG